MHIRKRLLCRWHMCTTWQHWLSSCPGGACFTRKAHLFHTLTALRVNVQGLPDATACQHTTVATRANTELPQRFRILNSAPLRVLRHYKGRHSRSRHSATSTVYTNTVVFQSCSSGSHQVPEHYSVRLSRSRDPSSKHSGLSSS